MSASNIVLDLIRAHYRGDEQAFRAFAIRLARITKSPMTQKTMLETLERARKAQGSGTQKPPAPPPTSPAGGSSILEPVKPVSLDDLLLLEGLRRELDEVVLEIAHRQPLAESNLSPRSRLLFSGPPGNGKTSAAAGIAHQLGVQAYGVSIPALVSQFLGATGSNLHALFGSLHDGTVVVLDEIDAIGGHRTAPDQAAAKEQNAIVNTLLTLMDRNQGGVFVATTNRSDVLDPALRRRFDDELYFPEPTIEQRTLLARRIADQHGIDPVPVDDCRNYDAVTKRTLAEARRVVMRQILADLTDGTDDLATEDEAPPKRLH